MLLQGDSNSLILFYVRTLKTGTKSHVGTNREDAGLLQFLYRRPTVLNAFETYAQFREGSR